MSETKSIFNERMKQIKEERNLSVPKMADMVGIPATTMATYLNNREPKFEILVRISDVFEVSLLWLIGQSEDRRYYQEDEPAKSVVNDLNEKSLEKYRAVESAVNNCLSAVHELFVTSQQLGDNASFATYLQSLFDWLADYLQQTNQTWNDTSENPDLKEITDYLAKTEIAPSALGMRIDSTAFVIAESMLFNLPAQSDSAVYSYLLNYFKNSHRKDTENIF